MTWINTLKGKRVSLLNPDRVLLDIKEIAHALSRINRFTGHIKPEHYSVAEHSVRCSLFAAAWGRPLETQLWALLHDAHEAFVGDISTPMKHAMHSRLAVGKLVGGFAEDFDVEIAARFMPGGDVSWDAANDVKSIDAWAVHYEADRLLSKRTDWEHQPPKFDRALERTQPVPLGWNPDRAKRYFLRRYSYLQRTLAQASTAAMEKESARAAA